MKSNPSHLNLTTLFNTEGLAEETINSEVIFEGKLLHIRRDSVLLPDGKQGVREYTQNPGAVMVIPVLPNGNLVMERQFRYPLQRVFVEFPAGKMDPRESPEEAAKRELVEETGYFPEELRYLTAIHPAVSYSTEVIHLFLARKLIAKARKLDVGEFLEVIELSIADALHLMVTGQITDAKTVIGLLMLQNLNQ